MSSLGKGQRRRYSFQEDPEDITPDDPFHIETCYAVTLNCNGPRPPPAEVLQQRYYFMESGTSVPRSAWRECFAPILNDDHAIKGDLRFTDYWDPKALAEEVMPMIPGGCDLKITGPGHSSIAQALVDMMMNGRSPRRLEVERARVPCSVILALARCRDLLAMTIRYVEKGAESLEEWHRLPKLTEVTLGFMPSGLPPALEKLTVNLTGESWNIKTWPTFPPTLRDISVAYDDETETRQLIALPTGELPESVRDVCFCCRTSGSGVAFIRSIKTSEKIWLALTVPVYTEDGRPRTEDEMYVELRDMLREVRVTASRFKRVHIYYYKLDTRWWISKHREGQFLEAFVSEWYKILFLLMRKFPRDVNLKIIEGMGWPIWDLGPHGF